MPPEMLDVSIGGDCPAGYVCIGVLDAERLRSWTRRLGVWVGDMYRKCGPQPAEGRDRGLGDDLGEGGR